MATIAMRDGYVLVHNGKVAADGERGCCYGLCSCKFYGAYWSGLNLLLDPSVAQGVARGSDGCLRAYADAIVADPGNNNCLNGGGRCVFNARIFFTGTWTLRYDKPDSPCWIVSDITIDEVVATNVECNCTDEINNATIYEQSYC